MFISRIQLYNWKNFHDCNVNLSERSFIIGANATGKSNFLDAMRFLRDIVRQGGGLQAAIDNRGGVTKIRCLAARTRTDVRIEVDLSEQGSS
jgi:predicted ATPase